MTAFTFDTHAYVKELQAVGFTEEQAEVQAKTLSSVFKANLEDLVTRRDMKDLELALKQEMKNLELRMVVKLGAMIIAAFSLMRMWPVPVQYIPPTPSHTQEMRLSNSPTSVPAVPPVVAPVR
ncbi:MAG: DUF1640 domain-containing protein [Magnetococcales bacterium]|nr:DUF1640 domain-containing protein [Magnetococcales bacterium]